MSIYRITAIMFLILHSEISASAFWYSYQSTLQTKLMLPEWNIYMFYNLIMFSKWNRVHPSPHWRLSPQKKSSKTIQYCTYLYITWVRGHRGGRRMPLPLRTVGEWDSREYQGTEELASNADFSSFISRAGNPGKNLGLWLSVSSNWHHKFFSEKMHLVVLLHLVDAILVVLSGSRATENSH